MVSILPLEVHDLAGFFKRMVIPRSREFDWNLRGLSITAPHKVEVMKFLDWIDPIARRSEQSIQLFCRMNNYLDTTPMLKD